MSRAAYLLGLFLAIIALTAAAFGALSLAVAIFNRAPDLDIGGWLLGTLPLLLNVGLLAALLIMLSPLVFSTGWRLFVLALIAMAFSSNFIGGTLLEEMSEGMRNLLRAVQAVLGAESASSASAKPAAVARRRALPLPGARLTPSPPRCREDSRTSRGPGRSRRGARGSSRP